MIDPNRYICFKCVSDHFLSNEIRANGQVGECVNCQDDDDCWSLEALAERVRTVFDDNYLLTPNEPEAWQQALMRDKESTYMWSRDGDSPVSIVEYLTGLPESICEELVDCWDDGTYHHYKDPAYEDPYGPDACYVEKRLSHEKIEFRWQKIQEELLHRSRFFSRSTIKFLEELFDGVQLLKSYDGPIVEMHAPEQFSGIYRARIAYDESQVCKILQELPNQLGALRGRTVSAGRMNAAGVTVMYGALEEETCIAEVRAPVGSLVVIGKFNLLRPIRVLNLKRLERCYAQISLFDPDALKSFDRMAFLRSLSKRLSVPVFNHTAHLDYLATQCIAEYIAAMVPRIDGVAFASAQAGNDAMNLVLFDDACHVAPLPHPEGTKVEIYSDIYDDGETDGMRRLVFQLPEKGTADQNITGGPSEFEMVDARPPQLRPFEPTLALDLQSIRVHRVESVKYESKRSEVWTSYFSNHSAEGINNDDF